MQCFLLIKEFKLVFPTRARALVRMGACVQACTCGYVRDPEDWAASFRGGVRSRIIPIAPSVARKGFKIRPKVWIA